jgi:hypothetical protein
MTSYMLNIVYKILLSIQISIHFIVYIYFINSILYPFLGLKDNC